MKPESFYIGWQENMAAPQRKALRKLLLPVFIALPVLALMMVLFTRPFNDHSFDLGNVQAFTGVYYAKPFPALKLDPDQAKAYNNPFALLVGAGKNGATGFMEAIETRAGALDGQRVSLYGTLIQGDGKVVIELSKGPKSLEKILGTGEAQSSPEAASAVSIEGEILDPKCWFGVMKPGEGKVHKSCAIRCISGGIPPVLRTVVDGYNQYYVLRGPSGEAINQDVLSFVGEPISVNGQASRENGWLVLRARPADIQYLATQ